MIGLGTDQVDSALVVEHNLESYYVNKHKGADAKMMINCLNSMDANKAKHVTLNLFLSTMTMTSKT